MQCNREEESVRNFAMVAKFLDLNKLWSCKYGWKRNNKIGRYMYEVPIDCSQEQNSSPYFSLLFFHVKKGWWHPEIFLPCYCDITLPLSKQNRLCLDTYMHTVHFLVALKSYNINLKMYSLRKENNDTKERKKGRKSEWRKGKKKERKSTKRKGQVNGLGV